MTDRPKILLVDDQESLRATLGPFLERCGFAVYLAADGAEALRQVKHHSPDLIVLDILMPELDGREVLRRLRAAGDWTPVIMLTQITEAAERTMSLEEGADDYVDKPFEPNELVARIKAVLRRLGPDQKRIRLVKGLACGQFRMHRQTRQVWVDGGEVRLSRKAFELLEYLMTYPGQLLTRAQILDAVWGWTYVGSTRVVDVRVAELRTTLGDNAANPRYIGTVPGQGYVFIGEVQEVSEM